MKAAVPAESYVIHLSSASLVSCDVYWQEPGRFRTLLRFNAFLIMITGRESQLENIRNGTDFNGNTENA